MSVCQRVHASQLLDLLIDQRPRFLRQHPPQGHVRVFVVSQCNANRRELAGNRMFGPVSSRATGIEEGLPGSQRFREKTAAA